MICIYCNEEIKEEDKKYFSKQPDMKGLYHWKCFVQACKDKQRSSSYMYETSSGYDNLEYISVKNYVD
jgi:hypothetical protein